MKKTQKAILTKGNVNKTIINLTLPMIFGMLGIVIFNIVDTFFISKLGTIPLAALTFTFPIILVVNSLAFGLGIGVSSVISRAVGEGNQKKVQRLGTDGLILSLTLVIIFVIVGLLTIDPVFRLLGANEETLVYIKEYMEIWYFGMIAVMIPMIGNNVIRGLGDTKTPAIIMIIAGVVNTILDPILIFGLIGFPALGMRGAAIATVISRMLTLVVSLYILIFREHIIVFTRVPIKMILHSWKVLLYIGIPNALTRMILPIATGIITKMIAEYGTAAIAGFGVATRIEFFALVFINALSSAMTPFVGQNYGAQLFNRIHKGFIFSSKITLSIGFILFICLSLLASPLAQIFNTNPDVLHVTVLYLRIVPIGYGAYGILMIVNAIFNAINSPLEASFLLLFQMFILYIPFAYISSHFFNFGLIGIFISLVLSYFISSFLGWHRLRKKLFIQIPPPL